MTTEENIVYQILNTVRAAELNNDEVVGERRVRSLMRIQRAEMILKYSMKGLVIPDECFQTLPIIELSSFSNNTSSPLREFIASLPPLIYLPKHFGIRLMTLEYENIPLVEQEDYYLAKHHPINKYKPKATITDQKLTVYANDVAPQSLNGGLRANSINQSIRKGKIRMQAVLSNPDDGFSYNWKTSEYPLPAEAIAELKNNVLRRDFQIILSTKSDQVPNSKNDTLRYHDQGKVQR